MNRMLSISLSFLLLFLTGCAPGLSAVQTLQLTGSGNMATQAFTFDKADRLLAASNFKVTMSPGEKVTVKVTADDNVMQHIYVHVSNGELRLEMKPGRGYSMDKVTQKAEVTMPVPGTVTLKDNATVDLPKQLQASELNLRVMGNGIVTGDSISSARLSLTGESNGQARLTGAVAEVALEGKGNAIVACPGLQAHTASVSLRENAMAALQVTDKLNYNVSENSGLVYTGSPQPGQQSRSANATVTQK